MMLEEFKTAVTRVLTPYASAILLDPEYGLPAAKAARKNAGLLLAYENSGYDNTQPGRLPDLLDMVRAPPRGRRRRLHQDSALLHAVRSAPK
jgi:tagatose-1,6-bisphosphate aldolase